MVKKQAKKTNVDSLVTKPKEEERHLSNLNKELYKRNLELAVKNKTLLLLGKLYEISIITLEPEALTEQLVTIIQTDFEFEFVGIKIYDADKDELVPLQFAESASFRRIRESVFPSFSSVTIKKASGHSFFGNFFKKKSAHYTEKLSDVFSSSFESSILQKVQAETNLRSILGFPLLIERKVIGIIVFGLSQNYRSLIREERDSIRSFINVIAVALDKATLYKKLKVTNDKLIESNKGQENLIHILNHQIKGYLAKSRMIFAELLTEPVYGPVSEKSKPMLDEGFRSLTEGVGFVEAILNSSSASSGTLNYDMKKLDFKEVVEEVANKQKPAAESKGLKFSINISDGDYNMTGDKRQLSQAVRNLLENSIIYTEKGSIDVSLSHSGNKITLSVKDTGKGIFPEDRPRLFTAGGRGKDAARVNVNSTGYGLSFVKNLVEAHHGTVGVDSAGPGKGSRFFMELPVILPLG